MFILGLRGQKGIKLLLEFQLLIIASGILLYLFTNIILEISICIVFFALYVRTIKRMIHYKDELKFKAIMVSKALFPDDKKSAKIFFIFHLFLFLFSFPLPIALLLSDVIAVFKDVAANQTQAMALVVFYYIGSLSLIGILIVKIQKYTN